jgi:branched-chain amino acid aminotransferase
MTTPASAKTTPAPKTGAGRSQTNGAAGVDRRQSAGAGAGADDSRARAGTAAGGVPKYVAAFEANTAGKGDRPIIFVNGRYVPKGEATVSVYDHGLLYGDGVFEGIRVYKGRIFMCGQHMDRLWKSADGIRLKIPMTRAEMVEMMRECIRINGLSDAYIRLVVTRGAGTLGLDPRKCPMAGVICIADQIALYPASVYETGMRIIVAKRPRVPIPCLDPRIKSLNYLNNILAKVEAIDQGCHEAIMLTLDGYVAECTGDNIFFIKGGRMYTPPSSAGMLEGITRRFVIERLSRDCQVPCEEKMFRMDEVLAADEVFLTGSAAEIIAVTQIDQTTIGTGKEGPLVKKLRKRFREIVTSENVPED